MELIERSRFTNSLHMQLFAMLEQVMDIAEDGIDDNLDPELRQDLSASAGHGRGPAQSIKAELQSSHEQGQVGLGGFRP